MRYRNAILLQKLMRFLRKCTVFGYAWLILGFVLTNTARAGEDQWTGFPDGFPILLAGNGMNVWVDIGTSGTPLAGNGDWYYDTTSRLVHVRFIVKLGNYDQTYVASQPFFGLQIFDDTVTGLPPRPLLDVLDESSNLSGALHNIAAGSVVAQKGGNQYAPLLPLGHAQLLPGFTFGTIPHVVFVHDVVPPDVSTSGNPIELSYLNSVSPWEWDSEDTYMIKGTFSYLAEPE